MSSEGLQLLEFKWRESPQYCFQLCHADSHEHGKTRILIQGKLLLMKLLAKCFKVYFLTPIYVAENYHFPFVGCWRGGGFKVNCETTRGIFLL